MGILVTSREEDMLVDRKRVERGEGRLLMVEDKGYGVSSLHWDHNLLKSRRRLD